MDNNNDNKLNILTKKIYEEGIEKAQNDAMEILQKARQDADNIMKEARTKADGIVEKATADAANLKQKTEAEMSMSVKQTVASLKQQITNLISDDIAKDMAKTAFKDKDYIQGLMIKIIEKWTLEDNADLSILLDVKDKEEFEKYILAKHKELLNKNLTIVTNPNQKEGFVIQPKDGNYKITFSEKVFENFFNEYIKEYSKKLLFS